MVNEATRSVAMEITTLMEFCKEGLMEITTGKTGKYHLSLTAKARLIERVLLHGKHIKLSDVGELDLSTISVSEFSDDPILVAGDVIGLLTVMQDCQLIEALTPIDEMPTRYMLTARGKRFIQYLQTANRKEFEGDSKGSI